MGHRGLRFVSTSRTVRHYPVGFAQRKAPRQDAVYIALSQKVYNYNTHFHRVSMNRVNLTLLSSCMYIVRRGHRFGGK